MKFPKLSVREIKFSGFVQFWSSFYNYSKEHLYSDRISKSQFTRDDIENLFVWKNQIRLSRKKEKSLKEKITDKLDIINKLKSKFCLNIFKSNFKKVSAIWKIHLLHIIAPQNYPIFDQHVYRAFCFLKKKELKEIPDSNSIKERVYFGLYVKFFNSLAKSKDISYRKKIDESLWAFGKFLKSYGKFCKSKKKN